MKKNKLLILILVFVIASLIISCNGTKEEKDEGQLGKSDTKIITLFMSNITDPFTMELSSSIKAKAEELGVELQVNDASNNVEKQISQIETAISQGIDGIILEAIAVDSMKSAIEAAKEADIPVVTVSKKIKQQELVNSFVGVSYEEGGELQMVKAIQDIGSKGNIALLLESKDSDTQLGYYVGYKKALKETNVKVVFENTAKGKKDEAIRLVENWLQSETHIHAIVAQNDEMALGALKAVEDAELQDKINIYGLNATSEALKAVNEGKLTATVSPSTTKQGEKAIETCYKLIMGQSVKPEIIVDHTLITIDNVEDYIKE